MAIPTPEEALVKLYGTYGPYTVWSNGPCTEYGCRSCRAGYKTSDYSRGLRHDTDCPIREVEITLLTAGYKLRHVHEDTLALALRHFLARTREA